MYKTSLLRAKTYYEINETKKWYYITFKNTRLSIVQDNISVLFECKFNTVLINILIGMQELKKLLENWHGKRKEPRICKQAKF